MKTIVTKNNEEVLVEEVKDPGYFSSFLNVYYLHTGLWNGIDLEWIEENCFPEDAEKLIEMYFEVEEKFRETNNL